MNTQHMEAEARSYEPPRMTIVPIRATGAMLIGSATINGTNPLTFEFSNEGTSTGNVATQWTGTSSDQGWDYTFTD